MATVGEHLKSAEDFLRLEQGSMKRVGNGDLMRVREGCEKVFHAYVEACAALIQKRGFRSLEIIVRDLSVSISLGKIC